MTFRRGEQCDRMLQLPIIFNISPDYCSTLDLTQKLSKGFALPQYCEIMSKNTSNIYDMQPFGME